MPDITNEPGTIQINSSKTNNINNLKLRANGFVNIYSTNLGGVPAAMDYGNMNLVLGSMKSGLLVSNIIPGAFHRLRGDIAAFSTDWSNLQTNDGTQKVTNYYVYHVLMVDQDLRSSFQPTGLNVSLSGNNIVLQDALQVMGNVVLQATNLTINSNFSVTGAAGNLKTANLPLVKNILIGTNGSIAASASIDLGVAASAGTVLPTKANTPILSITNLGGIACWGFPKWVSPTC
jgi:hypothetical protein